MLFLGNVLRSLPLSQALVGRHECSLPSWSVFLRWFRGLGFILSHRALASWHWPTTLGHWPHGTGPLRPFWHRPIVCIYFVSLRGSLHIFAHRIPMQKPHQGLVCARLHMARWHFPAGGPSLLLMLGPTKTMSSRRGNVRAKRSTWVAESVAGILNKDRTHIPVTCYMLLSALHFADSNICHS